MAITLEAIRAAGGIVHSDGNIFFRDISMLQGLAGAAPAAVAPALDVTLDEDQAGLLRDMLGDHAEYPEAITIRLMVGDGHSGHGLYVAQAEYQDEGAVLLASLPAPAAPQAPAEVVGWLHPQWAAEQGRGRIYGHNPGGYIAVQIAAPQAPAAPAEPIAWMATPVMQSGRGTAAVFCSDKRMADQWDYGGHPEYGRMIVTGLYAAPAAAPAAPAVDASEAMAEVHLLEEVCARYADDEDRHLAGNGEAYGSIPAEAGMKARAARKRFKAREAAAQAAAKGATND